MSARKNHSMPEDPMSLVVCARCGQRHRWLALPPRALARCQRCDAVLGRGHRLALHELLALTLAAAVVFIIANSAELIDVRLGGQHVGSTFPATVAAAWRSGDRLVASIAAITALIAPALFIGLRLYLLAPLVARRRAPGFEPLLRVLHFTERWNTLEVLSVAALLSLVRLSALADASPGPGLFALGALTLLMAAIESAGLRHLWWQPT